MIAGLRRGDYEVRDVREAMVDLRGLGDGQLLLALEDELWFSEMPIERLRVLLKNCLSRPQEVMEIRRARGMRFLGWAEAARRVLEGKLDELLPDVEAAIRVNRDDEVGSSWRASLEEVLIPLARARHAKNPTEAHIELVRGGVARWSRENYPESSVSEELVHEALRFLVKERRREAVSELRKVWSVIERRNLPVETYGKRLPGNRVDCYVMGAIRGLGDTEFEGARWKAVFPKTGDEIRKDLVKMRVLPEGDGQDGVKSGE